MISNLKNTKILAYLSGGVDSSVAAALLVNAGHDVTGAFMVDYDDPERPGSCWHGDYEDALRVCAKLGIKLLRLDFRKEYKKLVLDYMYKEYEAGRTPNPDVLCNKYIKFGVWLDKARQLGFDLVATGHYARTVVIPSESAGRRGISVRLLQAKDKNKDQSYFLHQLTQKQLQHIVFPLGTYTKPEVRKLAKKFKLPTADKEESMGICFIGEVPMKEFLQKKIKPKKGSIVSSPPLNEGEVGGGVSVVLGEHDGLAFYTIGQRIGVGCHSDRASRRVEESLKVTISRDLSTTLRSAQDDSVRPLFVVSKNIKKNELVVGYEDDPMLHKKEIQVGEISWISGQPPKFPLKCKVRLRHRQELQDCIVDTPLAPLQRGFTKSLLEEGREVLAQFIKSERAPTPGQFAVFYKKGKCLGGGVIK